MPNNDTSRPRGTARVPESVIQAIAEILSYYWDEEFAHYSSIPREERNNRRHIFRELNSVRRWLHRIDATKRIKGED